MRDASLLLALALPLLVGRAAFAQEKGSDVGGVVAKRRVTKMPVLRRFVEAEYPPAQKAAGITGVVILTIDIAAGGEVTHVLVSKSSGSADFDASAMAAAQQFDFEPAEVDDKPAPSRIAYRYTFSLRDEPAPPPTVPTAPPPSPTAPVTPPAPPTADEVVVNAGPRARADATQITISAAEARRVAGTQGDVLKVVQNLPGVSRPPLASGQLVVWGAAPRETHVFVDGVQIPALFHGSGLRSVMSSDLVSSIDLVPGAFGAEYGRGLGGLVRVTTQPLPHGTHGFVSVDTLDGGALVSTDLGDRVRIAVAGRQSWLDGVLKLVAAPDVSDTFPIPRYRDYQAKVSVDLRKNESVDVVFVGSRDVLTRAVLSADPAATRAETTRDQFHRLYARYVTTTRSDETIELTPFVGYDQSSRRAAFGGSDASLAVDTQVYGARGAYRVKPHRAVVVTAGIDALGSSSDVMRTGSLTLPPREGDVSVFGQRPSDELNADDWTTHVLNVAPHLGAEFRFGPLTITPGVRFEMFLMETSRLTPKIGKTPAFGFSRLDASFDPRLQVRYQALPCLAYSASGGVYHQAPDPEDLSAVFGTPDLGVSRARHVSVEQALRITDSLRLDMTGFYRSMNDLETRTRLQTPIQARLLVQNGEGRSYGVQFLLRQEVWRGLFGWASYTLSRSERRYEGDPSFRRFDYDQPHVLALVGSQEMGAWTVGLRFRYGTGSPRTPVLGATYDSRHDTYDPISGPQNSIRIPAFYQLDAKVERTFRLSARARLAAYIDVQNITYHANDEEIVYSANYARRDYITGLPLLAVVGARLEL